MNWMKKIKDWISSFRESGKTYDLGKLQKAGLYNVTEKEIKLFYLYL